MINCTYDNNDNTFSYKTIIRNYDRILYQRNYKNKIIVKVEFNNVSYECDKIIECKDECSNFVLMDKDDIKK